jgi:FAD/FMN-containing dehydrogenase
MSGPPSALDQLKEAAGPNGFTEDPQEIAPHLIEWRGRYRGQSPLMLKPDATAAVSRILAICNETRTPIVPQGGNTGLVGGQIPFDGEILLSLARLNQIRRIDAEGLSVAAEAGVILAALQRAAEEADRYFPLSLAAEGSCTIGGNISTNAGGVNVLRYGSMRDLVLGLEVVLADGSVLDITRSLRKDNTGYDLKQLFIGAEGTLGVVTAAVLKLFPRPVERVTCFAAVAGPAEAVKVLNLVQRATGGLLSAFELIPRIGVEFALAHIPQASEPITTTSPWYALIEASGGANGNLQDAVADALASAMADGVATDAVLASSDAQRQSLWRLRESLSEAQKIEGASIKHDVSVPIASIPEFLRRGTTAVEQLIPGVRSVPFGHLGDGNIHFNFSVPKGGNNDEFLEHRSEVNRLVHDIVREFGGSISAEHGIGATKRDEILRYKGQKELELMRALKRTLDPHNILNPGKLIAL